MLVVTLFFFGYLPELIGALYGVRSVPKIPFSSHGMIKVGSEDGNDYLVGYPRCPYQHNETREYFIHRCIYFRKGFPIFLGHEHIFGATNTLIDM